MVGSRLVVIIIAVTSFILLLTPVDLRSSDPIESEARNVYEFQEKFVRQEFCYEPSLDRNNWSYFFGCYKESNQTGLVIHATCLNDIFPDVKTRRNISCGHFKPKHYDSELTSYSKCVDKRCRELNKTDDECSDDFWIDQHNLDCIFYSLEITDAKRDEVTSYAKNYTSDFNYIRDKCSHRNTLAKHEAIHCIYQNTRELSDCYKSYRRKLDKSLTRRQKVNFYCDWFMQHHNGYDVFRTSNMTREMFNCVLNYQKEGIPDREFDKQLIEYQERRTQVVSIMSHVTKDNLFPHSIELHQRYHQEDSRVEWCSD